MNAVAAAGILQQLSCWAGWPGAGCQAFRSAWGLPGAAGAHTILQHPSDRSDAPAHADIQAAADLAAYFSKARASVRAALSECAHTSAYAVCTVILCRAARAVPAHGG